MTERGHQMTLAQPGAGDEHDIRMRLDEVQVEQILDQQTIDLGRPIPVELIERLLDRKTSATCSGSRK